MTEQGMVMLAGNLRTWNDDLTGLCSMSNKNPETDIGVQDEDQKSKAASHWLFPLPQSEMGDPAPTNPQTEPETHLLPSYIPL